MSTYSFTGFRIQYDNLGNPIAYLGASTLSFVYNDGVTPNFSYSVLTPASGIDLPVVQPTADNSVDLLVDGTSMNVSPRFDDGSDELLFGEITWDDNGTTRTTLITILYDFETETDYVFAIGGDALPTITTLVDFTDFMSTSLISAGGASSPFAAGDSIDLSTAPFSTLDQNDVMNGTSAHDRFVGGVGNDTLFGNSGNDTLLGGADHDQLHGGVGFDRLEGASGNDQLFGDLGVDILYGGVGFDTLDGGEGNDRLYGDLGVDLLLGGNGDDRLEGGGHNDRLVGGLGNDTVFGGFGFDRLEGLGGDDRLYGQLGADQLFGNFGNDYLDGGSENDKLFGAEGDDTLIGGTGTDTMSGGAGWDVFVFNSVADSGVGTARDVITDFASDPFNNNNDHIDLSALGITSSQYIFASAFSGSFTPEVRHVLVNGGADTLIQADVDGDGMVDFELMLLGFGTPGTQIFLT
ncbi:MAG: hypothetical protein KDE08_12950 [Rhodobacteraceae bacterium]|nr:hypothetical protein [Paracoccaceae bacterium]